MALGFGLVEATRPFLAHLLFFRVLEARIIQGAQQASHLHCVAVSQPQGRNAIAQLRKTHLVVLTRGELVRHEEGHAAKANRGIRYTRICGKLDFELVTAGSFHLYRGPTD